MNKVKFVCPKCKVLEYADVEVRQDEPMKEPEYPLNAGHWRLLGYELERVKYRCDHWNRTIVCPNCGHTHHYYEEKQNGKAPA